MGLVRKTIIGLVGVALLLACGGDAPPAKTKKARKSTPKPTMIAQVDVPPEAEFRYDPTGKQDPFKSFITTTLEPEDGISPLERFDLSQLQVSAIIWDTDHTRALVTDPAGKGYIVSEGTSIGKNKGRVVSIEDNMVRVKETYVDFRDRATTKEVEMRLYESQGG